MQLSRVMCVLGALAIGIGPWVLASALEHWTYIDWSGAAVSCLALMSIVSFGQEASTRRRRDRAPSRLATAIARMTLLLGLAGVIASLSVLRRSELLAWMEPHHALGVTLTLTGITLCALGLLELGHQHS